MGFDLIIRNGSVVDGSGKPAVKADIGIEGERITEIGDLSAAEASSALSSFDGGSNAVDVTVHGSMAYLLS